jgi:YVTN family beta-propeller protein
MRSLFLLVVLVALSFSLTPAPSARAQPPAARTAHKNPLDVTVDEKGETARVVLTGTRTIAVVDLKSGQVREELPWPPDKPIPEPSDISRHAEFAADLPLNLEDLIKTFNTERLPAGGSNLRGICAAGENKRGLVLLAHQRPKFRIPATQVAQGWIFTNALSAVLVGETGAVPVTGIILDEPHRAYADPSDVVLTRDRSRAFVACAGADTILCLDVRRLQDLLGKRLPGGKTYDRSQAGQALEDSYQEADDLTASRQYVIARIPVQANPRRLGISGDGKTLVVSNHLADSLTVIDAANLKVRQHISLGGPEPDAARRGEILFNSARVTLHGQFSCASCHPNGGSDGLAWDLTRDGVGNFKNTKSLHGVKETGPYGWLGSSPTLEDRVRGTLRTLHRYEPDDAEARDLAAYLASLPPLAPPPVKEADQPVLARGKALFEGKARCSSCHSGPAFDDGKLHSVGTGTFPGEDRFNTPSLRGISRTAPYLHDSQAATLEEIFSKHNPRQQHGDAHQLTAEELRDLLVFLRSI